MSKLSACVLALCLAVTSPAFAATVTRFSVRGATVDAFLSHFDETCGNNFLSVEASDQVTRDGSGKTATRSLVVASFGFNTCDDTNWFGSAEIPLTVPLDTSTVTLPFEFDVEVTNPETLEYFTRRIAGTVTLTGVGEPEKSRTTTMTQTGPVRIVSKKRGTTREAEVTANVTFGGQSFPLDPTTGTIGNVRQGMVEYRRD